MLVISALLIDTELEVLIVKSLKVEDLKKELEIVNQQIEKVLKEQGGLNKAKKRDGGLGAGRSNAVPIRASATPAKRGQPLIYGPTHPCWHILADGIRVGGSLSSVLAKHPNMPSLTVARQHIANDLDYQAVYEKAMQDRADRLAEEILEISDSAPPEGLEAAAMSAWVADKRLRVDARKWVAAKLQPKRYGDRIDVSVVDTRISVMDALAQAKQRVLADSSDVVDVESRDVD